MSSNFPTNKDGNKIMLGFIVRRCARELGHSPTPDEFAAWANNQEEDGRRYSLFGKEILPTAAKVMFRHLGRLVTVRSESAVKNSGIRTQKDQTNCRLTKR